MQPHCSTEQPPDWNPAVENYLASLRMAGCSPLTCKVRRSMLRVFGRWHGKDTVPEAASTVTDYMIERFNALSYNSAVQNFAILRLFFDYCHAAGLLDRNPLRQVRPPRAHYRAVPVFTDGEIERLFAAADEWNKAMMVILMNTGLRLSEMLALTWADIDRGEATIRGKGDKDRRVTVPEGLQRVLGDLPRKGALVIPYGATYVKVRFARLGARTGIHVHPHKFRHTMADRFIGQGGNVEDLACILGHSNINTTMTYLRAHRQTRALEAQRRYATGVFPTGAPTDARVLPFRPRVAVGGR